MLTRSALPVALLLVVHATALSVPQNTLSDCIARCASATPACAVTYDRCTCPSTPDVDDFLLCVRRSCGESRSAASFCSVSNPTTSGTRDDTTAGPRLLSRGERTLYPRISKAQKAKQAAQRTARTWGILAGVLGALIIGFFSAAFYRKHRREKAEKLNHDQRFGGYSWDHQHVGGNGVHRSLSGVSGDHKQRPESDEDGWTPPHNLAEHDARHNSSDVPLPVLPPQSHARYYSPHDHEHVAAVPQSTATLVGVYEPPAYSPQSRYELQQAAEQQQRQIERQASSRGKPRRTSNEAASLPPYDVPTSGRPSRRI